jgi:hypothetical protein
MRVASGRYGKKAKARCRFKKPTWKQDMGERFNTEDTRGRAQSAQRRRKGEG